MSLYLCGRWYLSSIWKTLLNQNISVHCVLVINCGEPEIPHGGYVTGYSFDVGAEVLYHCEVGHYSTGAMKRLCTREASWSGATPNCTCEYAPGRPCEVGPLQTAVVSMHQRAPWSGATPNCACEYAPGRLCGVGPLQTVHVSMHQGGSVEWGPSKLCMWVCTREALWSGAPPNCACEYAPGRLCGVGPLQTVKSTNEPGHESELLDGWWTARCLIKVFVVFFLKNSKQLVFKLHDYFHWLPNLTVAHA